VVPNDFTYLLYVFSFKNLSQNVFGTCNWGIPNINTEHCPTPTTNFPFATTCKSFQDTSPYYGSTISPNNREPQLTRKACIQLPTSIHWPCYGTTYLYCHLKLLYSMFIFSLSYIRMPPWSWSSVSWIYNHLCNQCLSPLKLWVRTRSWRGVLDTTLCVSDLRQVGGFLRVLQFSPPIKLTATI
jgi:hypothetical protein